jgi:hypothetical protein
VDALRAGGLSVTTGTVDEPALLKRPPTAAPRSGNQHRPPILREAAAAALVPAVDHAPGRTSAPSTRGCPSIVGVASIVASAKPAAGKRGQSAGAEAPVDELVTGIDRAALRYLDRPLVDATVVRDPVGLHEQAAAGREALAERAHQAERVLDAMQDPEAEDHIERPC